MDYEDIIDVLKAVIAEMFEVTEGSVTEDTRFIEDLNIESVDVTELLMIAEEEFDLENLTEEEVADIETVGDAADFVLHKMEENNKE
jgi:acyl carrier protein